MGNQSIPIVLPVDDATKARIEGKSAISLTYGGKTWAILRNPEVYSHRKEERCARTWGAYTTDHPHVKEHITNAGDSSGAVQAGHRVHGPLVSLANVFFAYHKLDSVPAL